MPSRRRAVAGAVALVVLVAAGTVAFLAVSDDADDAPAADAGVDLSGLDAVAAELVQRAQNGAAFPHHATYEQSDGSTIELWLDGERSRQEVAPPEGPRILVLDTGDEVVRCEQGDGWECDEPVDAPADVRSAVERLVADIGVASVSGSDGTIAGQEVRCFVVSSPEVEDDAEICLTATGVLARLAVGDDRLELTDLDEDVDDADFSV